MCICTRTRVGMCFLCTYVQCVCACVRTSARAYAQTCMRIRTLGHICTGVHKHTFAHVPSLLTLPEALPGGLSLQVISYLNVSYHIHWDCCVSYEVNLL